jgi:hypothetical protein
MLSHHGGEVVAIMPPISTPAQTQLCDRVGSVAQDRDDLSRAPDWLFFGL